MEKELKRIETKEVKLVTEHGVEVMKTEEAYELAESQELSLVIVGNPEEEVPVVKIMDYNKYVYDKKKREKENRSKERANRGELKEIRFSPFIDENDIKIKVRKIDDVLDNGDRVLLTIRYKGRSAVHVNDGVDLMRNILDRLECRYKFISPIKVVGNSVQATITYSSKS